MSDVDIGTDDDSEVEIQFDSDDSSSEGRGPAYAFAQTDEGGVAEADEQKVEITTIQGLKEKYENDKNTIMSTLGLSEGEAWRALRHYNWDVMRVTSSWFEATDKTKTSLGISTSEVKKPKTSLTCPVCFEDHAATKMLSAGCEHFACRDCWQGYLKAHINDKAKVTRLKCIGANCKVITPFSVLFQVADDRQADILRDYEDRLAVETNPLASYCCRAGCELVAVTSQPAKAPTPLDVQCKCGQTYCFACKEPEAHRPVACDTVQAWNIKNSAESENLTWIIANTKPCPECQRPIQKNQGCMHMTCSQCRHEFCWLCQGDWKKHGEGTGGYYACNKYEQAVKEGTFDEEETRRRNARNALERYTHYYERFHSHDVARQAAVTAGAGTLQNLIGQAAEVTKLPEGQMRFLMEANAQIVECRRILKWTYAYGYYKFDTLSLPMQVDAEAGVTQADVDKAKDTQKAIEARKALFEFLQNDAESSLEKLSQSMEQELKRFTHMDEFWRLTKKAGGDKRRKPGMDDHEFIAAEFHQLQSEIVNLTQLVKKFFDKLVLQLEQGLEGIADQYAGATAPIQA